MYKTSFVILGTKNLKMKRKEAECDVRKIC